MSNAETNLIESETASSGPITESTKITLFPAVKAKRIWEIDFLRGFCVILMVLDHLALMLANVFGPSWFGFDLAGSGFGPELCRLCDYYLSSPLRRIGHPVVLLIFFSISGISCTFSRSNVKRGSQLFVVALLFSAGSYIVQELLGIPGTFVLFGVLHFYAVSILFYALLRLVSKNNKAFIAVASAVIIIITLCLYHLYTPPADTPKIFSIIFPPYDIHGNPSLFYTQSEISPGDWFTFVPYSAFFFFGTLIGPFLYGSKRTRLSFLDRSWHKPVTFIGRHALVIYLLHIVLVGALLAVISYLFVTPGSWGF